MGLPGHQRRDLRELVRERGDDVIERQDSDEYSSCVDHRHAAHAERPHASKHGRDIFVLARGDERPIHDVTHIERAKMINILGQNAHHDIAIREHADGHGSAATLSDDDEVPHMLDPHATRSFDHAHRSTDMAHLPTADFADAHCGPP